jgi:hypothetical protein
MKKLILILTLFFSLLVSGCYDIAEELWINSDGSGRMKFTIGLAENLAAMIEGGGQSANFCDKAIKDKSKLENNVLITSVTITKNSEAGMNYCSIDVDVKDFRNFAEVRNNVIEGDYDNYEFPFSIIELGEDRFGISQEFNNLGRDGPNQSGIEKVGQEMAMAMMAPMLAGKYISITVHAANIESSNGEISADSKTVIWKKPLVDLVRYPEQPHRFEIVIVKTPGLLDRLESWWNSI